MMRYHCLRSFRSLTLFTLFLAGITLANVSTADSPPPFEPDALRADFDALYEGLKAAHFNLYARRSKAEYDLLHERLRERITAPMSLAEAEVLFQEFVAYGRIAHANVAFPAASWEGFRRAGGKALPIFPQFDGERFLVSNSWLEEVPEGAELLALDGESIASWTTRLRRHLSADSDYMVRAMLEYRWPALLWLEVGEREQFDVQWRDARGVTRTTTVKTLTQSQLKQRMSTRDDADRAPREFTLREDGIAYLRPGPFYNIDADAADPWDPRSFIAFVDSAFGKLLDAKPRALLIDLRDNPGGDTSFSDPLIAWFADKPFRFVSRFAVKSSEAARAANLARIRQAGDRGNPVSERYETLYSAHPPGSVFEVDFPAVAPRAGTRFEAPVYLLINRHSYSTAAIVAALAQDHGFARILGEETSDLATTYGAMEHFNLPRTGIQVGFPKAYMVRPNGDESARGVVPDLAIHTPAGDDSWQRVLDQALAAIDAEQAKAVAPQPEGSRSEDGGS